MNNNESSSKPLQAHPLPPPERVLNHVAILECKHAPYHGAIILKLPSNWCLILYAEINKGPKKTTDMISHPINYCPFCGIPLDNSTPTRTYILGQLHFIDDHLKHLGVI